MLRSVVLVQCKMPHPVTAMEAAPAAQEEDQGGGWERKGVGREDRRMHGKLVMRWRYFGLGARLLGGVRVCRRLGWRNCNYRCSVFFLSLV